MKFGARTMQNCDSAFVAAKFRRSARHPFEGAGGHKVGHDEEMQCLSICHGRTCSGHPRLGAKKVVDARDKRGHDGGEAGQPTRNVMAGLVPAIHVLVQRKSWMPGIKPA
jgi:hypothetical protein